MARSGLVGWSCSRKKKTMDTTWTIEIRIWWLIALTIAAVAGYVADLYVRWHAPKPGALRRFPLSGFAGFITALLMLGSGVAWEMFDAIQGWLAAVLMFGVPLLLATLGEILFRRRLAA